MCRCHGTCRHQVIPVDPPRPLIRRQLGTWSFAPVELPLAERELDGLGEN